MLLTHTRTHSAKVTYSSKRDGISLWPWDHGLFWIQVFIESSMHLLYYRTSNSYIKSVRSEEIALKAFLALDLILFLSHCISFPTICVSNVTSKERIFSVTNNTLGQSMITIEKWEKYLFKSQGTRHGFDSTRRNLQLIQCPSDLHCLSNHLLSGQWLSEAYPYGRVFFFPPIIKLPKAYTLLYPPSVQGLARKTRFLTWKTQP